MTARTWTIRIYRHMFHRPKQADSFRQAVAMAESLGYDVGILCTQMCKYDGDEAKDVLVATWSKKDGLTIVDKKLAET